ncbi:MAG: hypothetical protein JWM59_642 [Verrucomicrobiales bacterium]|nr:hypothetical protein [Verrucomicrobiales bacterium]
MTQLPIALAVVLPTVFGSLYSRFHQGWVVQAFGCACRKGFNANTLSLILHSMVALGSTMLLFHSAARLPLRPRMNAASLGLILITASSFYFWQLTRTA